MGGRSRHSGVAVVIAALAAASGVAAVLMSHVVFPYLSINNDEGIIRLQAESIANGHLFPPTLELPDAFRPWMAAVSGNHYVLKYTPVVPALVAVSRLATGGADLYLAMVAAAVVVMTYLLARAVLGDRTEAVTSSVLVALSPLVLVHSGLLLPYLPTFLLLETFAWALLRGLSTGRGALLVLGGAALGLAFFARAFDAIFFAVPLLAWAAFVRRGDRPTPRQVLAFVLPVGAALAVFLAFNAAATGSPFRPPFSLLEASDTLGFGTRRMYPSDSAHSFGPWQGLTGVVRHGALLGIWVAGGAILAVLAVSTLLQHRAGGACLALAASAGALLLSYVVFWGPWNATVLWGGTRYVGPFYFVPLLIPLVLLGSRGLHDLFRRRRSAAYFTGLAMAAVTGATLTVILAGNLGFTRENRSLARLVAGRAPRQLVFTTLPTPFLMHPTAVVSNRWDLGGPVVYAVERGDADLDAVRLLPDRTPYRLRFRHRFLDPDRKMSARLEQLRLASGERLTLDVVARRPPDTPGPMALAVSALGVTSIYELGDEDSYDGRIVVDGAVAALEGRSPVAAEPDATGGGLEVSLVGADGAVIATEQVPLRRTDGGLELLAPDGPAWTVGETPLAPLRVTTAGDGRR